MFIGTVWVLDHIIYSHRTSENIQVFKAFVVWFAFFVCFFVFNLLWCEVMKLLTGKKYQKKLDNQEGGIGSF